MPNEPAFLKVHSNQIRNQAAAKDPQFYSFLRQLEEYQRFLGDNRTMLLLSTHRGLFDALFEPPGANGTPAGKASIVSPGAPSPATSKTGGP